MIKGINVRHSEMNHENGTFFTQNDQKKQKSSLNNHSQVITQIKLTMNNFRINIKKCFKAN